jgi:hypothetical protein
MLFLFAQTPGASISTHLLFARPTLFSSDSSHATGE